MEISLDDVRAARARIAPHIRRTPSIAVDVGGRSVRLKLEQLQVGASFKSRGACNRILAGHPTAVITASGGNHGVGVAYAASRLGVPATIFLPERAPRLAEDRARALGARVVRAGLAWDDAWAEAEREAQRTGAQLIHPFEDPAVIAGQGTIALELVEDEPEIDLCVVAIGGGGLIGGVSSALSALRPGCRIVGVEPTGATSMLESVRAGRVVALDSVHTIAGTLAPRSVGPNTLELCRRHVADIVLVSDDEMRAAMGWLWNELRLIVEPAGAAALAAVLTGKISLAEARHPVVLVCGANLDAELAAAIFTV